MCQYPWIISNYCSCLTCLFIVPKMTIFNAQFNVSSIFASGLKTTWAISRKTASFVSHDIAPLTDRQPRNILLPMLRICWLGGFLCVLNAANVPLTMLEDKLARCMDGSLAGYYAQPFSKAENKHKWVLYLNGGGECDTQDACQYQAKTELGSSNYFPQLSSAEEWFFGSDNCNDNPLLCSWNHVKNPYCSQDLHSGRVQQPSNKTWNLYFSGHLILTAILDALDKSENTLKDATDIIVSGVSAGGIGVWMNVDYIAERYPNARVTAATVAGHYFYAYYYEGVNHTSPSGMADFTEFAWPTTFDLYEAFVDESCLTALSVMGVSGGACMLSNVSWPFIKSDSFVVQSQTDSDGGIACGRCVFSVVLTGHDLFPEQYMNEQPEKEFMHQWHENMTTALLPLMKNEASSGTDTNTGSVRTGVFAVACYTHCDFNAKHPLLSGLNYYQAFNNFYLSSQNSTLESYRLQDDCGEMCNPTCNA